MYIVFMIHFAVEASCIWVICYRTTVCQFCKRLLHCSDSMAFLQKNLAANSFYHLVELLSCCCYFYRRLHFLLIFKFDFSTAGRSLHHCALFCLTFCLDVQLYIVPVNKYVLIGKFRNTI